MTVTMLASPGRGWGEPEVYPMLQDVRKAAKRSYQTSLTSPFAKLPEQHRNDLVSEAGVDPGTTGEPAAVRGLMAAVRGRAQGPAPGPISRRQPNAFTSNPRPQN